MMQKKSTLRLGLIRALALLPIGIAVVAAASSDLLASEAENLMHLNVIENSSDDSSKEKADEPKTDETIYDEVEVAPQFPGGETEMYTFLARNIRYPEECAKRNIQGGVTVQFVVKADGTIGDVKIVRGTDPELDGEAARVIRTFPKFIPGKKNGEPVNVWYTLPINFKMQ